MKVVLKLAVGAEAHAAHDAHRGGGIGVEPLREGTNAQKYEFPWMFQSGPNGVSPLGTQQIQASR